MFAFLAEVPAAGGRLGAPAAGRNGATSGAIGGGPNGTGASAAAQPSCLPPDAVRRSVRWSDQMVLPTAPPAPASVKVSRP